MGVSWNGGTPKSSIPNRVFHEITHPAGYLHDYGNPHDSLATKSDTLETSWLALCFTARPRKESAMAETLKVAIIGAGLGGLTLAKTLLQPEQPGRPVEVGPQKTQCLAKNYEENSHGINKTPQLYKSNRYLVPL